MSILSVRYAISQVLAIYELLIFAYAVMSWLQGLGPAALGVYRFLAVACEPFVGLIRRLLPRQVSGAMGLDLSPMAAMLVLIVLQRIVY